MKKQINPTIKAHLIRSAFYLLLLLGVCAIPFALAQRNAARQSMAKPAIVNPAESKSGLAIAANPDFQGAPPKKDDVTKTPEVPVSGNPDLQDLNYPATPSSTFAGAHSDYQSFLPHGIISCGANNMLTMRP
jgi:hypothetical protein